MIEFIVVRWSNFLSTGNTFTEMKLNESTNTLLVGENGSGKSTILDALCFGLFGKPFRRINKPLLVNSLNGKNCEVQVEFKSGGREYKIIRGIKPNIFEIFCDGVLVNQDSTTKDYQQYLEKFILRMNYKSFTQIVILGSASFTPFMQLTPADRRIIIEDLLDIQIFSVMNTVVKQKILINRDNLEANKLLINSKEERKSYIESMIDKLKKTDDNTKKSLIETKSQHVDNLAAIRTTLLKLSGQRDELRILTRNYNELKDKHTKLVSLASKIDTNLKRSEKHHDFYCETDNCPTCHQTLEKTFRAEAIASEKTKIEEYKNGLEEIHKKIKNLLIEIQNMDELHKKIQEINTESATLNAKASSIEALIDDLHEQIRQLDSSSTLIKDNESELKDTKQELKKLHDIRTELLQERQYLEIASNLLKDGGIKSKIIKQYLPVINKQINKYLSQMGFFVNFTINEQFEESIKSRFRDEFSYNNFSEGEKMRIDLALMLTWRAIAKMRNSINTNLLILDEIFDGSLDVNGTDEFMKIMINMLSDTNTFIISHKQDQLIDRFEKVYRFVKTKNFSRLDN